jgi:DNA polymerase-1
MFVSSDLNKLSHAEAYCFYRDQLGWHTYPVYPPSAKVKDPGKQPAVKEWWNFDPHDCDIDRWFNPKRPYNIGLAPKNGLVLVDLDSKPDKGASVRAYLDERSQPVNTPTHITRGGVHEVYLCPNLPKWTYPANGKPYHERLTVQITPQISAELYHSDHRNVVLPPSQHPIDGFIYTWTIFGEVQVVTWQWLQDTYGFRPPDFNESEGKPKKSKGWWEIYRGDLSSLDLIALLKSLGHDAQLDDEDEGRYIVKCPWRETEHSDPADDTGAKVWQQGDAMPGFYCHHNSCRATNRSLKEVLEWAEGKSPGIVDKFCAQERVWHKGQTSSSGLPRVLHPDGRLETVVYEEVGKIIGPEYDWFVRGDEIVVLRKVPSGFVYSDTPGSQYSVSSFQVGLGALSSLEAKSSLEKYIEPGYLKGDPPEFVPCSFSTEFCAGLLQAGQLKSHLFDIVRVLTVALPFRIEDKLLYPSPGYDSRFGTFLLPEAPVIKPLALEYALEVLERLHGDFCFTNEQSKTHAIAALLTPFAKAIIGWTARTPLWYYSANRPRAGKDYLRAITLIVYEGHAFEDLPIGDQAEETSKRIMAAARSGRRFMHFSNCQAYLEDPYLTQALTNPVLNGRRLGSNDASSDLSVPNEIDFSLSANVGHTYRDDFEERMRKIELAYFEEDPNERKFKDKFLHRTVKENRSLVLSAVAALFNHWAAQGFPVGQTDFISYPHWAEVIGGVMVAAGLPDPCLPFKSAYDTGGDLKTAAMAALFRLCFKCFGNAWVSKKQIYQAIEKATADTGETVIDDVDALRWFGPLEDADESRKNQTKLGLDLRIFKNRILGGIKMTVDESATRTDRHRFRFQRIASPDRAKSSTSATSNPENAPNFPQKVETLETLETFGVPTREKKITTSYGAVVNGSENVVSSNDAQKVSNVSKVAKLNKTAASAGLAMPCVADERKKSGVLEGYFLALDLETYGEAKISKRGKPSKKASPDALNPWKGNIRLVTVGDGENTQVYDLRQAPLRPEILTALGRATLIVHYALFDLLWLKVHFGVVPREVFCTMTAARLLSPGVGTSRKLGPVLERYLGVALAKEHGGDDWGALVLSAEQIAYAHDDVRYLHALEAKLCAELKAAGLWEVFQLEMRLIPIVIEMEHHGFTVDRAKLNSMRNESTAAVVEWERTIREAFKAPALNVGSPVQLLEAFKSVGIELENTNEETLGVLESPEANMILEYRGNDMLTRAIEGLLKAISSDGRIHARFEPTGARTGRFSSRKPNLQNINRGPLRSCFVPSAADRCLIVADYSQIELRIAAYFAGERAMLAAFRAENVFDRDLHCVTAAAVLSKAVQDVTKDDRQLAKAVNFGFLYGQGAQGFQRYARTEYGIVLSLEEATELRDKFFARYVGLAQWHRNAWEKAENGVSEARTILGRLLLAEAEADDWARFQLGTSYLVSGSAADVIKSGMVKCVAILPSDVHMVATVHDELIFDSPRELAEHYKTLIKAAMEESFRTFFPDMPIEVEAKVVNSWSEK